MAIFPASIYLAWKQISSSGHTFEKFVVCPKCSAVYKYPDAIEKIGTRTVSKRCSHTEFPNHRQARMRRPCNATLLKSVNLRGGKQLLVPKTIYPYKSVIETLEQLIKQKNFIELCEQWRQRHVPQDTYADVYDGQIWKDFQKYDEREFWQKQVTWH